MKLAIDLQCMCCMLYIPLCVCPTVCVRACARMRVEGLHYKHVLAWTWITKPGWGLQDAQRSHALAEIAQNSPSPFQLQPWNGWNGIGTGKNGPGNGKERLLERGGNGHKNGNNGNWNGSVSVQFHARPKSAQER